MAIRWGIIWYNWLGLPHYTTPCNCQKKTIFWTQPHRRRSPQKSYTASSKHGDPAGGAWDYRGPPSNFRVKPMKEKSNDPWFAALLFRFYLEHNTSIESWKVRWSWKTGHGPQWDREAGIKVDQNAWVNAFFGSKMTNLEILDSFEWLFTKDMSKDYYFSDQSKRNETHQMNWHSVFDPFPLGPQRAARLGHWYIRRTALCAECPSDPSATPLVGFSPRGFSLRSGWKGDVLGGNCWDTSVWNWWIYPTHRHSMGKNLSCPSWRKRPLAVEVGQQSMPKSSAPVAAELWSLEGWVIHTWLIYNSSWNKNIVLNQQVRDTPREHMGRNWCFCDGASQFFSLKPPLPQTRTKRVLRFHGGFWAEPGSPGWVWEWGIDRQKLAILQF